MNMRKSFFPKVESHIIVAELGRIFYLFLVKILFDINFNFYIVQYLMKVLLK